MDGRQLNVSEFQRSHHQLLARIKSQFNEVVPPVTARIIAPGATSAAKSAQLVSSTQPFIESTHQTTDFGTGTRQLD